MEVVTEVIGTEVVDIGEVIVGVGDEVVVVGGVVAIGEGVVVVDDGVVVGDEVVETGVLTVEVVVGIVVVGEVVVTGYTYVILRSELSDLWPAQSSATALIVIDDIFNGGIIAWYLPGPVRSALTSFHDFPSSTLYSSLTLLKPQPSSLAFIITNT